MTPRRAGEWWSWPGAVALTLALGVGAAITLPSLVHAVRGEPMGDVEGRLLYTVAGAAIGALATYLGQAALVQLTRPPPPPPPPPVPLAGPPPRLADLELADPPAATPGEDDAGYR
jgi:hypothetical protein